MQKALHTCSHKHLHLFHPLTTYFLQKIIHTPKIDARLASIKLLFNSLTKQSHFEQEIVTFSFLKIDADLRIY